MTIEDEIARALAEWRSGEHAEPWEVDMYMDAATTLSPVLNRVRAEAQVQAFREMAARVRADFSSRGMVSGWVGALDDEAARIEQEGAFMSGPSEAARQHLQEWRATREQNSEGNET